MSDVFVRSEWWPLIALAPAVWLLLVVAERAAIDRLSGLLGSRTAALAADHDRRVVAARRALFAGGLLFATLAALQPTWGESTRPVEQRGVDVVVCLDVSRSMLARDVSPSRLAAAHAELAALAERAHGDRLGLVAFAGESRIVVPLTRDAATFADLALRTDPLSVERGGTDLGAALDTALVALAAGSGENEAIVLLTDGEDHEGRGLRVAARCRERGIAVHCVGFGSARGSKIPVDGPDGEAFLRDRAGDEILTRLDPTSLRALTSAADGVFVDATESDRPLLTIYEDEVLPMARKTFASEQRRQRKQRFQWPLAVALGLWILELCLTDRRR